MPKFMVMHTLKVPAEQFMATFTPERQVQFAQAVSGAQAPARCIKSWQGAAYGRPEWLVCLWEAEKAEDVTAALSQLGMLQMLTADTMQVDEIDWAQIALSAPAPQPKQPADAG